MSYDFDEILPEEPETDQVSDDDGDDQPERKQSEVERRLVLAECYRALLGQKLFSSRTVATDKVQREIAEFCQARLEVLVGIRAEGQSAAASLGQFTQQEVTVLKALVKTALDRTPMSARPEEPPTIKPVAAPKAAERPRAAPPPQAQKAATKAPAQQQKRKVAAGPPVDPNQKAVRISVPQPHGIAMPMGEAATAGAFQKMAFETNTLVARGVRSNPVEAQAMDPERYREE